MAPVTPAADSARPRVAAEASSAAHETLGGDALGLLGRLGRLVGPIGAVAGGRGGADGRLADDLHLLDLDVGALGDLADRGGDLLDRAAGLVGGAGHLARGLGDAAGGAGDLTDDRAQVGDEPLERVAQQILVGARHDRHRQVAVGDALGDGGLLTQVLHEVAEGRGQAADLVVGRDVDADAGVTVGQALGAR
jgi:hypothetical protein